VANEQHRVLISGNCCSKFIFSSCHIKPKTSLHFIAKKSTYDYIVIDSLILVRCPCNASTHRIGRGALTWPVCLSLGASPRLCVSNKGSCLYQISIKRNGAHFHYLCLDSWDTKDEELQERQKQRFGGKMRDF